MYLSTVIWPKSAGIDHAAVVAIEGKVSGNNVLSVRALRKDRVEKEDTFVEGKDFALYFGHIRLKQRVLLWFLS
jgi:hypothetical protein